MDLQNNFGLLREFSEILKWEHGWISYHTTGLGTSLYYWITNTRTW